MLARIRNAQMVRHATVLVPHSKVKAAIALILKEEGFIQNIEQVKGKGHPVMKLHLRYAEKRKPVISGLQRVSKPGLRRYVGRQEIPRVYGGIGVAIVSTTKGIMTGAQAKERQIGGELLCYIW